MIGPRFNSDNEGKVAAIIRAQLAKETVGCGFGSLAGGADILFAEALLERGAEVNIVLPLIERTSSPTRSGHRARLGRIASNAVFPGHTRSAMRPMIFISVMTPPISTLRRWRWAVPCCGHD
jgi:hypothetical protein